MLRFLQRDLGPFPLGIWLSVVALSLLLLAMAMQAYSLLFWDSAVSLGLQTDRFTSDPTELAWARESRGVALADMIWPLPLAILALYGILRRSRFGAAAGLVALSISVYFPLVFCFQRFPDHSSTALLAIALWAIPGALGILGLTLNLEVFND